MNTNIDVVVGAQIPDCLKAVCDRGLTTDPDGVLIGDFPLTLQGQPWIIDNPGAYPYWPPVHVTSVFSSIQLWRTKFKGDCIELSTDLPGVKADDINVEIDNGTIKVAAKRADINEDMSRTYVLGTHYDLKSCIAVLEHGVLTISVKKLPEHLPQRVKVTVK